MRSRTLRSAPWRRAPLLIWRHLSVVVAVAASAMVLATVSAALPLFVSSVGGAAVGLQISQRCGPTAGVQLFTGVAPGAVPSASASAESLVDRQMAAAGARPGDLGPATATVLAAIAQAAPMGRPRDAQPLLLASRTGALSHVQVLATAGGTGLWIPDTYAAAVGIHPGDILAVGPIGTPVRVAAVYRDLEGRVMPPFWCSLQTVIGGPNLSAPPPSMALMAQAPLLEVAARMGATQVELRVERAPRAGPMPVSEAQHLAGAVTGLARATGLAPDLPGRSLFRLQSSELPVIVSRSSTIQAATRRAVLPVVTAGAGVALLLVGGAGSFWVDRRRTELDLLSSRGVSPAALAAKAVLELAGVVAAGAVLGWLLAWAAVAAIGPSPALDRGTIVAALVPVAAAAVAGLCLLGAVAALRTRARESTPVGTRRSWSARLPWEAAPIAIAVVLLVRAAPGRIGLEAGTGAVPYVPAVLLGVPLVFMATAAALCARGLTGVVRLLRPATGSWPPAAYLAVRRVASARLVAATLVTATALSTGALVYASALAQSERATLAAKAHTFVGSDVSVQIPRVVSLPPSLARSATIVRVYSGAGDTTLAGQPIDVIGVDPATFLRAAATDAFAGPDSPIRLMAALGGVPVNGSVPIITSGANAGGGRLDIQNGTARSSIQVRIAAQAASLPGRDGEAPVALVDDAHLSGLGLTPTVEVWARGDPDAVAADLRRAGAVPLLVISAATVFDLTDFAAIGWTFDFVQALGFLTGVITVAGLLLYLETRQRSRNVAYLLARRMGLSRVSHRRSLLAELGPLMLVGFGVGAALSVTAVILVHTKADPLPVDPPGPVMVLPTAQLAGAAAGAGAVAVLGTVVAQRAADRARPAELLRGET